jgi:hypothetical protein
MNAVVNLGFAENAGISSLVFRVLTKMAEEAA